MKMKLKILPISICTISIFSFISSAWGYYNMRDCKCENSADCGQIMSLQQTYKCKQDEITDPNASGNSTITLPAYGTFYLYAYCYPPSNVEGLSSEQYYSQMYYAEVEVPLNDVLYDCSPKEGYGPDTAGVTYKQIICKSYSPAEVKVQLKTINCQVLPR